MTVEPNNTDRYGRTAAELMMQDGRRATIVVGPFNGNAIKAKLTPVLNF